MINIRPISDIKNKYQEIEELVLEENEDVYLTKNGYGSMVIMNLEKYSDMMQEFEREKNVEEKFGDLDFEKILDEIEKEIDELNTKVLEHEEVFAKLRKKINDQ